MSAGWPPSKNRPAEPTRSDAQPQRDEALDVGLHLAAVADLVDHLHGVLLELLERGHGRLRPRRRGCRRR